MPFWTNTTKSISSVYLVDATPRIVEGGQWFLVDAMLRNRSREVWESEGTNPWMASYHWFDLDGRLIHFEGERTPLPPGGIKPGADRMVVVRVRPPHAHGHFRLMITVVREGFCWQEKNRKAFTPAMQSIQHLRPTGRVAMNARNDLSQVVLAPVEFGQMLVLLGDEVIGQRLMTTGSFEETDIIEVTAFLKENFQFQPECFVDIGANIGTHLIFAIKSGLFSKAIGFEADSVNYTLLKCNVLLNGVEAQSDLYQVALSDSVGQAQLELSPTNFGDHRIRSVTDGNRSCYNEQERETRPIVCNTLDGVLAESGISLNSGCLVWIDTQGHEGRILSAAPKALGPTAAKFVILELWPYGLERSGGPGAYFEFLSRCRFIYDIGTENWQTKGRRELQDIKNLYDVLLTPEHHGGISHTNLLCIL